MHSSKAATMSAENTARCITDPEVGKWPSPNLSLMGKWRT
jgi:hypothetical protein